MQIASYNLEVMTILAIESLKQNLPLAEKCGGKALKFDFTL